MAELIVTLKGREIQRFAVMSHAVYIGRAPQCDLVLPNESVSREHASLSFTQKGFTIQPLTDSNSLWLNGKLCTRPTPLVDGDRLQLGKYVLTLSLNSGPPLELLRAGEFETSAYTTAMPIEEIERYRVDPQSTSGPPPLEQRRQERLARLEMSLYLHRVALFVSALLNLWLVYCLYRLSVEGSSFFMLLLP